MSTANVYEQLSAIDITLPEARAAAGSFAPFTRVGSLLYLSGHIARQHGKPWVGQLGAGFGVEEGRAAARAVAIDLIGTLHAAAGDLNRIRVVKLMVLVNSTPTFTEQHVVANGASDLFLKVFGERGSHARSAIGVAQLPFGSLVEIELIAEIEPGTTSSARREETT
jgi:enamine deaminase RidA (YjgF/YER057c/UK114 family)